MIKLVLIILALMFNSCYAVEESEDNSKKEEGFIPWRTMYEAEEYNKEGYVPFNLEIAGEIKILFVKDNSCLALQTRIDRLKYQFDKELPTEKIKEKKAQYEMEVARNILNCLVRQSIDVKTISRVHRYVGLAIESEEK